jgi:hypothetical protein
MAFCKARGPSALLKESGRWSHCGAGFKAGHKSCSQCGKSRQSDSLAACAALESDMAHIFGFERSQLLLLPETVDDYVGADNPVRFIDAFDDQLDLAAAGFIRVAPAKSPDYRKSSKH